MSRNRNTMRNFVNDVKFFNWNLIDFIENINDGNINSVSFDQVDDVVFSRITTNDNILKLEKVKWKFLVFGFLRIFNERRCEFYIHQEWLWLFRDLNLFEERALDNSNRLFPFVWNKCSAVLCSNEFRNLRVRVRSNVCGPAAWERRERWKLNYRFAQLTKKNEHRFIFFVRTENSTRTFFLGKSWRKFMRQSVTSFFEDRKSVTFLRANESDLIFVSRSIFSHQKQISTTPFLFNVKVFRFDFRLEKYLRVRTPMFWFQRIYKTMSYWLENIFKHRDWSQNKFSQLRWKFPRNKF